MLRFCANLNWLFQELPILDRFAAAKDAGFDAVELLNPYELSIEQIRSELTKNSLRLALINCPPPSMSGALAGFAAIPGPRFRTDFMRAQRYAETLNSAHMHLMSGVASGDDAHSTFVENLRWAAKQAPSMSLTIEPINTDDMPGYFLCDFDQAHEVVKEIGASNLNLQFDAYHAHKIHRDVLETWKRVKKKVVHVQVAQPPLRSEPAQGEIDFDAFFQQLRIDRYAGWISAEYRPQTTTVDGLGWLLKYS